MLNRLTRRFLRRADSPSTSNTDGVEADSLPPRIAILLTNPRSGSTWLFDALRCHPAITIEPEADIFRYFGMTGRRYPRDLAGDAASGVRVEVRPSEWETLPAFQLPEDVGQQAADLPAYSLEKCHPHFFKQDVDGFVAKLRELDHYSTVRMIYQVRDPQESLLSFLRYKERNPTWNAHLEPDAVPAHMQRIYESLLACARVYPGLIVDYVELESDTAVTLGRIFHRLWHSADAYDDVLLDAITSATGRDQRQATTFLGQQTTNVDRDKAQYGDLFERHAHEITATYDAYNALLALRDEERDE
jgi:hypothetical protein